ncbi:MAG: hydrolase [Rhizobiaceae bacterium MnEN-MB40S]|nr:MAG: hydrolase [Rhizobiaceae bacterium MnEN-MB40S]
MAQRTSAYIRSKDLELHVSEWGNPSSPFVMMWHGLARTGRDFDEIAEALSDWYFVVCPDTVGRGLSSWMPSGDNYSMALYCNTVMAVVDHYGPAALRWVGTSMGGLIGIRMAAEALKGRITHLVINDIGPEIPEAARQRIADYVGNPPEHDTVREMGEWLKTSYAPFGDNPDSFWNRLVDTSVRRTDSGRLTAHYDPAIAAQFIEHPDDFDTWSQYDAVEAKTLLVRGADSDVLAKPVAEEMLKRGPKPQFAEFSDIGHAPTFVAQDQQNLLREFLAS